jgi:hypothetical protein
VGVCRLVGTTSVSTAWLAANNTPSAALISGDLGLGVGAVTNTTLVVGPVAWGMLANGTVTLLGHGGSNTSIAWIASQTDASASLTFSVRGLGDSDVLGHLWGANSTWGANPVLVKETGTACVSTVRLSARALMMVHWQHAEGSLYFCSTPGPWHSLLKHCCVTLHPHSPLPLPHSPFATTSPTIPACRLPVMWAEAPAKRCVALRCVNLCVNHVCAQCVATSCVSLERRA